MGLTRAEQETILRWDEEEHVVHLYSASPKTWRKAARLGLKPVKETTLRGEPTGKFYRFPLEELTWRVRKLGARQLSPAERDRRAAALARAREGRQAASRTASDLAAHVNFTENADDQRTTGAAPRG